MKRHLCLSILVAAMAAPAAPLVHAGANIVKCVDGEGRITLTDQACDNGSTTVRLANTPADEGITRAEPHPLAVEHGVLPPPPAVQRRQVTHATRAKPMMRDVATLKAARAQLLLLDAGAGKQTTLATLD